MRSLALLLAMAIASVSGALARNTDLPALRGIKRILILGDSITYSGGYVDALDAYIHLHFPNRHIDIINIGLPSETVSGLTEPNHAGGAFPRPDLHDRLVRALAKIRPDLVLACYGINDGIYYPFASERFGKYQDGIRWLSAPILKTGARMWLLTPPPFDPQPVKADLLPAGRESYPSGHGYVGYDEVLTRYSEWLIQQRGQGWNVIDIHQPLNAELAEQRKSNPDFAFAGDGVHLSGMGHRIIAREVLRAWGAPAETLPAVEPTALPGRSGDSLNRVLSLVHERQRLLTDAWLTDVGHSRPGMPEGVPIAEALSRAAKMDGRIHSLALKLPPVFAGSRTDYHGFDRYDFDVDGTRAIVVTPREIDPKGSRPWIWRAEFFDHRPELDLALLSKGFYLVYIEVGNTFGAPSAMKHWDAFYKLLTTTYGLSKKPTLEGLSRGGLYIYNWAARHPKCVSVLYGDNPVCDFKSWPGGKGKGPGSPEDWKKLQGDYGFRSEAEALAYTHNPIDELASLARAHVPIIHCAADADEVVPYLENTVILKERYEKLGGLIKVIVKPGFKHHPHGLDDPTPLVEFILAHTSR